MLLQVVLIGDGFAEGLGDWVVMGGMAGVTRQLQMHAGTDDKVQTNISAYTYNSEVDPYSAQLCRWPFVDLAIVGGSE